MSFLPRQDVSFVDQSYRATNPFYIFLQDLDQRIKDEGSSNKGLAALISEIATILGSPDGTVKGIPATSFLPDTANVIGQQSIQTFGLLKNGYVFVTLLNDLPSPGKTYVYGTKPTGFKGWYAFESAIETSTLAKVVDADGIVQLDLAELEDTGIGDALVKITRDVYGRVEGTEAATTDDLDEGDLNLYYTDDRADARIELQKGQPLGLATLDSNSKLDAGQLPALAITETFVVADEAAMLALVAEQGDVAVRMDLSKSFILTAPPASTLGNWQELLNPTSAVISVFGRTGSVVATSGDYTFAQIGSKPNTLAGYGITDAEPTIVAGTITQYWRGDKSWQTLNKAAVGLGNVDNTSDIGKPVSTAQTAAFAPRIARAAGASSNASQALPSATLQKVLLATEEYDNDGIFNPATSRFTPVRPGLYLAVGAVAFSTIVAGGSRLIVQCSFNGGGVSSTTTAASAAANNTVQHTMVYLMNGTTDYIELMARQDTGSAGTISGSAATRLDLFYLGPLS